MRTQLLLLSTYEEQAGLVERHEAAIAALTAQRDRLGNALYHVVMEGDVAPDGECVECDEARAALCVWLGFGTSIEPDIEERRRHVG